MARRQAVEQLPPFATIAPDDRRGALWIAALLSLIFVTMTLGARLYVRKHMLGRDDFAAMAAVALAVAQYAALFAGMPSGLGTSKLSVTAGNERKNGSLLLTSQAVFMCGLYMAKLAVLLATERLLAATMKTVRRVCLLIRGALAAAALASILLITLRCATHSLLSLSSGPRRCSGLGQRWVIIAILDAVTETAILCVFYGLVWSLQMRAARKWMLTLLLGLRLLCPVFTGIYTSAIQSYANSSDPAVEVMSPLVWQQVALGYSLIAALLIALIPFLRSFHTGMVLNVQNMGSGGSGGEWGSSARSRDNVYRLKNLSTKISKAVSSTSQPPPPPPRTVPLSETEVTRSTSLRSGEEAAWRSKSRSDDGAGSADGAAQEPMVIQKTVDWSVQYEEGEARGLQHPGLPGYLSTETTYR
ncbi:hypothetical protein CCM_08493 [Cordyceps militaris CM01]|uniref:Rhodopsin domain-containing protein n=1 Tax=Cordyceps militaris (strain CM01) TaxID=983644 RepID=G3JRQ9_CORMM|nr:uncharacterized protein CCM_08493 [Cordyceps militaris CM01]EGX88449.1 hypothetical protein CCM_08493 [Cordyceps militaris CM01]